MRAAALAPRPEHDREKQTVEVEIYGVVRDLIKEPKVEIDLSGRDSATFSDVLESLADRFGPVFRERIFDREGRPLSHVKVYTEGRAIKNLEDTIALADGVASVRIIVFAAAGGG